MLKTNVSRGRQNVKIGLSKSYILVICLLKNNFNLLVVPGYVFFTFLDGLWTPPTLKKYGFTYIKQYFLKYHPFAPGLPLGWIWGRFWLHFGSQNPLKTCFLRGQRFNEFSIQNKKKKTQMKLQSGAKIFSNWS